MSPIPELTPQQNIEAFIDLITDKNSGFSPENRTDLEQQIDNFPKDVESLSDAISNWCLEHPETLDSLSEKQEKILNLIQRKDRGQAENNPPPEGYKTLLKNQIQVSFKDTKITQDTETTEEKKPSDSNK